MSEETAPAVPVNLRRKLVNVMAAVGYIQKKGRNKFHGYNYATEADVAEKVRAAFVAQGLVILPTVKSLALREIKTKNGDSTITRADCHFTLLDADSDETLEFDMPGEGQDPQDKGVYKAITGAEKYALMKLFLIPTGDDPEKDGDHDNGADDSPKINETGQEALRLLIERAKVPMGRFLDRYNIATLAELAASDLQRVEKDLTDYIAATVAKPKPAEKKP